MKETTHAAIRNVVMQVLNREKIAWELLVSSSTEVIAYGSTVFQLNTTDSDVDLICIGFGDRQRSHVLDLKWISPSKLLSSRWLESELATHIAAYGIWLYGNPTWREHARVSQATVDTKSKLIINRTKALTRRANLLQDKYRQKHSIKIRRDLQRLWLLTNNQPVITTSILDYTWHMEPFKRDVLQMLFQNLADRPLLQKKDIQYPLEYASTAFLSLPSSTTLNRIEQWLDFHIPKYQSAAWSKVPWQTLIHSI